MRIALVSTPFVAVPPPGYGGTELVVHALARALVGAGHAVTVFATADSRVAGADVRAAFTTPAWPPDPYSEVLHCRFAAEVIAREGFEVVHAHCPALLAFAGGLPAPVVYTIHHGPDPALSRFYARVDGVVRVAISARQAALAEPAADQVVHHGLEPELYPVAGPGGDRAFFLGRMSWCKGPELAVEAARRAGLPLVAAGRLHDDVAPPGWREEVLFPALAEPHVRWEQEADLARKRRLFARSRALLAPLRWEEPFGLVLIEAMLAGCPAIAFPRGAAPEIVEDGVTGFLVDDVAGMATALRRAGTLDRRRIQARARARFSADRMARDYLAIYEAAAAGWSAGRVAGEQGWSSTQVH